VVKHLTPTGRRKAVMRAAVVAAALGAAVASAASANAAPKPAVAGSAAGSVAPQNGTGSNSWVTETLVDQGSQVAVSAWMNAPAPVLFSFGHWQILTPTTHFNTGDATYQDFHRSFPSVSGNYCAIWWYRDGSGVYHNQGEPCVPN
jgi:hypothetical protein